VLDLQAKSAFERLRPAGTGGGVIATERLRLGIATVMRRKDKGPGFAAAVKRKFGFDPPDEPRRVSAQGTAMLGIGRGKWLAIGEHDEDGNFFAQLSAELEGLASVIEQSNALGVLRLSGPMLYPTMEKECSSTWRPRHSLSAASLSRRSPTSG
jgi:methylglutamate dehydrogenase subunit D